MGWEEDTSPDLTTSSENEASSDGYFGETDHATVEGDDPGAEEERDTDKGKENSMDTDADADTDTDFGADVDADSDSDSDADTRTEVDADADTDADVDDGVDSDDDTDINEDDDTESDTGADTGTGITPDTDTDVDLDLDTDTGADAASDADADAESDTDTDVDTDDYPEDICVSFSFGVERLAVKIMIVLDRSGSMNHDDKWSQATAAIEELVYAYQDRIDFGLDLYSINVLPGETADNGCDVNSVVNTDTAPNNAEAIMEVLDEFSPGHATPLLAELNNFREASYAPSFLGGLAETYLLVISDGMDNCGIEQVVDDQYGATTAQLTDAVTALRETMNLKTIVIGFGEDANPDQLNAIAAVGGTELDTYIDAIDGAALEAAMSSVATEVAVSCSFNIGEQDPDETDLDLVNVRFDGEAVPRDDGCAAGIGWRWSDDTRTVIELCDQACDTLKSGAVSIVSGEIACRPQDVVVIVV